MLEEKKIKLTPVSEFGEVGLLKHLAKNFSFQNESSEIGLSDDAAVMNPNGGKVVASTNLLAEGVHFNSGYVPLKHLGYKAVIASLSDIVSMNVKPTQILFSIAASNRFPVEAFEEIYQGVALACQYYQVDLVSQDVTSSQSGLILNTTAIGIEVENHLVKRSGAKVNDLLLTTGDLGGAYMGLQILEREHVVYLANPKMQPEMEGYEYILEKQLKPEARVDMLKVFKELDILPTSMINLSRGLASEILHLSDQSKVGFVLYEEKIPLDTMTITTAEEFNINPVTAALNGGEDYELLFTIAQEDYDKIKNHPDMTIIGHAVEENQGNHLVLSGSQSLVPLTSQGWDAFLKNKNN